MTAAKRASPERPDTATPAVWPGLLLVCLVGVAARGLHAVLPAGVGAVVGEVLLAIGLGLLVANLTTLPASVAPGFRVAVRTLLPLAIVLLGARMALDQIVAMGAHALLLIGTLMTLAMVVAHGVGRWMRIPVRVATLIAVGAAICGNTAIAALAPVIKAEDDEVAFAIAINTLFGTLAMLSFPLVGHALGFSDAMFGTWAGVAVNDTSQVVATGFAYSEEAGEIATVVKLTRNACMAFVIVGVGLAYSRATSERQGGPAPPMRERLAKSVPNFLIGFLILAAANTLGLIDAAGAVVGLDLAGGMAWACKVLVLLALAGVGLSTNFRRLARTGLAPVWLGLFTMMSTTMGSLALLFWLGPVQP